MNDANDDLGNFSKSNECIICGQIHNRGYVSKPPIHSSDKTTNARLLGMITLPVFLFVAFMQIITPNYMGTPRESWERAAICNVRTIAQAEASFKLDHGRYGTFDDLIDASEITSDWGKGIRGGYAYSIELSGDSLEISARPAEYGGSTKMSYLLTAGIGDKNNDYCIHASDKNGGLATSNDPIMDH